MRARWIAAGLTAFALVRLASSGWGQVVERRRPADVTHPGPPIGNKHGYALVMGTMASTMAVLFIAFQGATPLDLYGKVVLDVIGLGLLIALGFAVSARESRLPLNESSPRFS